MYKHIYVYIVDEKINIYFTLVYVNKVKVVLTILTFNK